jgi:hypothetical protein
MALCRSADVPKRLTFEKALRRCCKKDQNIWPRKIPNKTSNHKTFGHEQNRMKARKKSKTAKGFWACGLQARTRQKASRKPSLQARGFWFWLLPQIFFRLFSFYSCNSWQSVFFVLAGRILPPGCAFR